MKTVTIICTSSGGWETLDGQSICVITEEDYKDLCDGTKDPQDLLPISEILLST